MSPISPITPLENLPKGPRAKNKKKKTDNHKSNGNLAKNAAEVRMSHSTEERNRSAKIEETEVDSPDKSNPETSKVLANTNTHRLSHTNETMVTPVVLDVSGINPGEESDASIRFEALSQEREALRAEVESLRKSLEEIQDRHTSDLRSINCQHEDEISKIKLKHNEETILIQQKLTEEISLARIKLEESETAKVAAETQYQHLLERVNTIKSSLGERFKADKLELAEAKSQIEELDSQREANEIKINELTAEIEQLKIENQESLKEISNIRNLYNLSQQNLSVVQEDLVTQTSKLKNEAETAKEATGGWEMLAMEERSMREALTEKTREFEEQILSLREALDSAILERNNHLEALDTLRNNLKDFQAARNQEYREMVESYETQLDGLKKVVQESDLRSTDAESSKAALQAEVDRLLPVEKELKEKNLLVGKLRHEAIVLNDHLTKALRFLKKAKPEDNIDRQIVTNHFLHFLALDRSDPKKFEILQLIASLLNWTDEQKEQAGLARPGTSNFSHRFPATNFHRTPSSPSISADFLNDAPTRKESFSELWKNFLERSAEESELPTRSGSVNIFSKSKTDGQR